MFRKSKLKAKIHSDILSSNSVYKSKMIECGIKIETDTLVIVNDNGYRRAYKIVDISDKLVTFEYMPTFNLDLNT